MRKVCLKAITLKFEVNVLIYNKKETKAAHFSLLLYFKTTKKHCIII